MPMRGRFPVKGTTAKHRVPQRSLEGMLAVAESIQEFADDGEAREGDCWTD